MLKRLGNTLLRRGVETAVQATAETAAATTSKEFRQVFTVAVPVTVYIRASHCEVTVYRHPGNSVELLATLRASFGWEFVTEQDQIGVYIVARRKLVVGALSYARFDLTIPPEANLVLHLSPGDIRLANVDGKLTIPPLEASSPSIATSIGVETSSQEDSQPRPMS